MLHVMRPLAPGQVRGISWLAPIVLPASELDQLTDALLVGCKIAAMHAGFLIDQNGTMSGTPYEGKQNGSVLEGGIEPGTLKVLPSGVDIKFNSPQAAQQTAELVKHSLRGLAAGLGLPTHLLDGDLANANYSSLRAGLLPFRQRVEQTQYGVFAPQLLNPLWGRVQLFAGNPDASAEWIMPAWLQVDPLKAVNADIAEIDAGLKSRRQAVAERGWSVDALDRERAADREREAALKLTPAQESVA
jgi:lambda family phage portal protein